MSLLLLLLACGGEPPPPPAPETPYCAPWSELGLPTAGLRVVHCNEELVSIRAEVDAPVTPQTLPGHAAPWLVAAAKLGPEIHEDDRDHDHGRVHRFHRLAECHGTAHMLEVKVSTATGKVAQPWYQATLSLVGPGMSMLVPPPTPPFLDCGTPAQPAAEVQTVVTFDPAPTAAVKARCADGSTHEASPTEGRVSLALPADDCIVDPAIDGLRDVMLRGGHSYTCTRKREGSRLWDCSRVEE